MEYETERIGEEPKEEGSENKENTEPKEELEIPAELEGMPKEIAQEAITELEGMKQKEETKTEELEGQETYTHEQYKAKEEELAELKAQLEEYRRRVEKPPARAEPQKTVKQKAPKFNEAALNEMKKLIEERAMEMTGFTKEDVADFEFSEEDDDKRAETFKYAKEIAKSEILEAIQQARKKQIAQEEELKKKREENVKYYNEFATKAMGEADFPEIQKYAIGEYFDQLDAREQEAVSGAYYRVERQMANATDIALVKNYYKQAAAAYRSQNKQDKANVKGKIEQANKLPKSDQLKGTTATGEISVAELSRLIDETEDVTKIPEKYRRKIAGY